MLSDENRELCQIRGELRSRSGAKVQHERVVFDEIPYSNEQGTYLRRAGIFFA
jgi:hypothetical protein